MSTTMTADKFVRTDDFASRLDGICLPNEAWAVFSQLGTPASVADLSSRLQQPVDVVGAALATLTEHGLIRKHLLNWREFLAQSGVSGFASPTPAAIPVDAPVATERSGAALAGWPQPEAAPVIAETRAIMPAPTVATERCEQTSQLSSAVVAPAMEPVAAPVVSAVPAAPAATTPHSIVPRAAPETVLPVSFAIVNDQARFERKATAAMTISFSLSNAAPTAPTTWKLNPLLKAIAQKAGGGLPGQLLVYRVFIHVPAALMHAAGIQSISLVDDSVVIRDRAFYDALCQAARVVASIDLSSVKA